MDTATLAPPDFAVRLAEIGRTPLGLIAAVDTSAVVRRIVERGAREAQPVAVAAFSSII